MAIRRKHIDSYYKPSLKKKVVDHDRKIDYVDDSKPQYEKPNLATDRRFSLKNFPVRSDIRQSGEYAGEKESVAKLLEEEKGKYVEPSDMFGHPKQAPFDRIVNEIQKQLKLSKKDSGYLARGKWAYIEDDLKKGISVEKIVEKIRPVQHEKAERNMKCWTMFAWDNGEWHERFSTYADKKPNDSETIKWLPYGEKPKHKNIIEETTSEYDTWLGEIYKIIEEDLEVSTSDAQGIVDAQEFILAQSWGRGITPMGTAVLIKNKSRGR